MDTTCPIYGEHRYKPQLKVESAFEEYHDTDEDIEPYVGEYLRNAPTLYVKAEYLVFSCHCLSTVKRKVEQV